MVRSCLLGLEHESGAELSTGVNPEKVQRGMLLLSLAQLLSHAVFLCIKRMKGKP